MTRACISYGIFMFLRSENRERITAGRKDRGEVRCGALVTRFRPSYKRTFFVRRRLSFRNRWIATAAGGTDGRSGAHTWGAPYADVCFIRIQCHVLGIFTSTVATARRGAQ